MSRIQNPRGICVLENAYDGKGRTIRQKFADGGVITYDHQEELSRTLVTEQNGNKVAHVYDERYRNVGDIYVDGEEHTSIFNGKLSSLTGHFVVGISRMDMITPFGALQIATFRSHRYDTCIPI